MTIRTRYVAPIKGTPQYDRRTDVSFHVFDKRGRLVGMKINEFECDFVALADGETYYNYVSKIPGHYFAFWPHATRDGVSYGPSQKTQYFLTEAERARAIAKYIAGAHKRATKAFG